MMDALKQTKVPLGVTLVFYALQLTALCIIIGIAAPNVTRNVLLLLQLYGYIAYGLIGAGVISLLGKVMCLNAPKDMKGAGAIYLSVGLDVLVIGIGITGRFTLLPFLVRNSTQLLTVAAFVAFVVFLKALGSAVQRNDVEAAGERVLKVGVFLVLLLGTSVGLLFVSPSVAGIISLLALVVALIGLVMYSRLLQSVMKTFSAG